MSISDAGAWDPEAGTSAGMRKRNTSKGDQNSGSLIKKFDIYQKVHDDYNIKTKSGGTLSLVVCICTLLLVLSELRWYLATDISDHIVVDTTLDQKLAIGLNITFPALRCEEVSVDTVDSSGDNQINVHSGELIKLPLDEAWQVTEERKPVKGECLSCFEAQEAGACCNTCAELKRAYIDFGLPYYKMTRTAEQCKDVVGCRIEGDVQVSKVDGNVHVALGKSTVRQGRHVHEFNIRDVSEGFNTTHVIHRLQFGDSFDGLMVAPLEGTRKVVHEGSFMFHYYIRLIPTIFLDERDPVSTQRYSHQYSSTEASRNVLVNAEQLAGLPGVFLVYEFSPFLVQKRIAYVPFTHFLTSLCVIIGGIFTITRALDQLMYTAGKRMGRMQRNLTL